MQKILIFLITLTIFTNKIEAATPSPDTAYDLSQPLAIPELLDIALRNNPSTKTAWWNARRAAAALGAAKSSYYPTILLHGDVVHGRDYKFINGQETTYTTAGTDLILSYLLIDFGERKATSDAARAALSAANWQTDWAIQTVLFEVLHNAYAYLNAQEQLISRNLSLKDTQDTLDAANDLLRVGLRTITDIYTLKATISDMEINIALQKAEADIAKGKLAASLGLDVNTVLVLIPLPNPRNDQSMKEGLDCLITRAQLTRADMMAKRAQLQQKIALAEKTRKAYCPKLNLNADTGYRRYFDDKANGLDYNVGLNIDFPLFNGFETTYRNRYALSDVMATENELASLELDIALEVLTYHRWFEAAQEIIKLSQENLENSTQTFGGVLDKYKAGTQSIFDLVTSQRLLADARIRHGDAKTRWYRTLAQLAYATGTIMSLQGDSCVTSH
jgi:outer membrane protein